MRISLIVTTYNRPRALGLVIDSVARQTVVPHELVIADDGSTAATAEVIEHKRNQHTIAIVHQWQEDRGFRAARVRNLGVTASTGDYLIFVDGDMLLHPEFVRSHIEHCKPGRLLHGPRVLISDTLAETVMDRGSLPRFHFLQKGVTNRFNMFHNLALSRIFSRRLSVWGSRGCNISLFKADFIRVNGFNEDFQGWGREDSEFVLRLMRSGVEKLNLRFCAVSYHLGHGWNNERTYREEFAENNLRLEEVVAAGTVRCANGLSNHSAAPILQDGAKQE